jgi:hypothetical protein
VTWPSRFLAAPVSALTLGDEVLMPTAKASQEDLRRYVASVPAVHDRLAAGFTEADFRAMRTSPLTQEERAIGETYVHLYSPAGRDSRIEAEFRNGVGLVVTRGRHRYEAAKELGLPFLPVHVRAADQQTLDRIGVQLESEICQIAPEVVEQHRALDVAHKDRGNDRSPSITGERARSTEVEPRFERER